ncbi:hypothetical protein ACWEQL_30870, partial [Kitasatospora sp. NPDC004240]
MPADEGEPDVSGGGDWRPCAPGRHQLGEGARWHAGRLYFVDLLRGTLYSCGPGGAPDGARREFDLGLPLGAVAPVAGRPGEWVAAAGPG